MHQCLKLNKRMTHFLVMILPKCVLKIRLNKIGFDILADTYNMCYTLTLQIWQLEI